MLQWSLRNTVSVLNSNGGVGLQGNLVNKLNENSSLAKTTKGIVDIPKDNLWEIFLRLFTKDILNIAKTNTFLYKLIDEKFCQNYLTQHYPQCLPVINDNRDSIQSYRDRLRILALGRNIFVSKWGEAVQINIKYEDTLNSILYKYLKSINADSRQYYMSRDDWNLGIQFVLFGEKYTLIFLGIRNSFVSTQPLVFKLLNHNKNKYTSFKYIKKIEPSISDITLDKECILFTQRIYIPGPKIILRNRKLGLNKNTIF
jgi:hypothetical protein